MESGRGSIFVVFSLCFILLIGSANRVQPRPVMRLDTDVSISIAINNVFDVRSYGAIGDGETDDTDAFVSAWKDACSVESGILVVPPNYKFLLKSTVFKGDCGGITFQLDGLITPPDMDSWSSSSGSSEWLVFHQLEGIILQGKGFIEGKGDKWWDLPCKPHRNGYGKSSPQSCDSPAIFKFRESKNITVLDIKIYNSPQVHMKFDSCDGVHIENVMFNSPASSPNTDGIHIEDTKNVQIFNIHVTNGDDCISIGAGCHNVDIRNATCVSGHGISIGSLGVDKSLACVSNISVTGSSISDSENGLRIKTWQGGSGRVSHIKFVDVQMNNVRNPLIIDQYYCMGGDCQNDTAAVYVTDVMYKNVKGTYNPQSRPMHFTCSDSFPCTQIALEDVELKPDGEDTHDPLCWKVYGGWQGSVYPQIDCLQDPSVHAINHTSNGC